MRFVKGDQIRGKKASVFSLGPKRSQFNSCARLFWYKQQDTEGGDRGGQGAPEHGGGGGGGRSAALTTDGQAQQRSS
jgi:hypothetical protein